MKTFIAGLAAASALVAAAPAAQAGDHGRGHGYGHERHQGYDRRDHGRSYYAPPRYYGHYGPPRHHGYYGAQRPYGYYGGGYGVRRHGYATRCFWRHGREICVRRY